MFEINNYVENFEELRTLPFGPCQQQRHQNYVNDVYWCIYS